MLVAKKGNKEVFVDTTSRARYLNEGYTLYEDGKIVEYGRGYAYSPAQYLAVVEENERLKETVKKLEAQLEKRAKRTKKAE